VWGKGGAIQEELMVEIETGKVSINNDPKTRGKYMQETYGWDKIEAGEKLWCFGPDEGANILVDAT